MKHDKVFILELLRESCLKQIVIKMQEEVYPSSYVGACVSIRLKNCYALSKAERLLEHLYSTLNTINISLIAWAES